MKENTARHYQVAAETTDVRDELDVVAEHLRLDGARVLELGCGAAAMTRRIAERFEVEELLAAEVDRVQLARNRAAEPIERVRFADFGAESIAAADATFDCVLMFKSLHHVPVGSMDRALAEVARVLRPGGQAYLSEPVYAGDFNDILRMFHDEGEVRRAAFEAIERAIEGRLFEPAGQVFFRVDSHFESFADFESRILQATHTEHRLDPALYQRVRARFETHLGAEGARFFNPIRVDLLRRTQD